MAYWILKTEPETYSFEDLTKQGRTVWDGVRNPQAISYIRSMRKGDTLMIYHTGKEKRVVGIAEALSAPHDDPAHPGMAVIEIGAKRRVKNPITLSEIKSTPSLAQLKLIRQPRLSVIPVPEGLWEILVRLTNG